MLEAVLAVTIVVLANGMERPRVEGAAKLMVSADPTSAPEPEREIAVPASGEEVATLWYADAPPYRRCPTGAVVVPVPPEVMASAEARVNAPVDEKEEVAVAPKDAVYALRFVEVAPLLKRSMDVVALCPTPGCVQASYAVRPFAEPHALAVAESVPSLPTCRQRVPTPPADERMRFVDEAVVAVTIVVDANGIFDAIPSPRIVVVAVRPIERTS